MALHEVKFPPMHSTRFFFIVFNVSPPRAPNIQRYNLILTLPKKIKRLTTNDINLDDNVVVKKKMHREKVNMC